MKKIYFATTNEGKLKEAKTLLGIEVEGAGLEGIEEIQSLDPVAVATRKAQDYYAKLKKPILVEDVSLTFLALNLLPGTYIDSFIKSLGNDGLVELLRGKKNRRAIAQTTLVFVDKKGRVDEFIGKTEGGISLKPKGEGFGWDPIFIPKGSKKTFGEMSIEEKNKYSMRAKAFRKFAKYLNTVA